MKKIILSLFLLAFCLSIQAQTTTFKMFGTATYQIVTTDYNLDTTTAKTFIFQAAQHEATTQDYIVKLDSVFGNQTNVAVALYGQKSAIANDWTQISSTVNWVGTTSDTTIIISNATANRYRNYKAVLTGTGNGRTKIDVQELKLYK